MSIGGYSVNTRDANEVGASNLLPAGDYKTIVKAAPLESDKTGGVFVGFQFLVLEGDCKGRVVFERAYVHDPVGKKANYGKSVFKSLGKVFGYPEDWSDAMVSGTVGKRLVVSLEIEPENKEKGYKARNRITGFSAEAQQTVTQPTMNQGYAPQPMQAPQTQAFQGFAAQPLQAPQMPQSSQYAQPAPQPGPVMQQPMGQPPAFMQAATG